MLKRWVLLTGTVPFVGAIIAIPYAIASLVHGVAAVVSVWATAELVAWTLC